MLPAGTEPHMPQRRGWRVGSQSGLKNLALFVTRVEQATEGSFPVECRTLTRERVPGARGTPNVYLRKTYTRKCYSTVKIKISTVMCLWPDVSTSRRLTPFFSEGPKIKGEPRGGQGIRGGHLVSKLIFTRSIFRQPGQLPVSCRFAAPRPVPRPRPHPPHPTLPPHSHGCARPVDARARGRRRRGFASTGVGAQPRLYALCAPRSQRSPPPGPAQ